MGINKKINHEDLKQYVTEDLVAKVGIDTAALKKLKFNHAVSSLDNPASIHSRRRDIARMLTELRKRALAK